MPFLENEEQQKHQLDQYKGTMAGQSLDNDCVEGCLDRMKNFSKCDFWRVPVLEGLMQQFGMSREDELKGEKWAKDIDMAKWTDNENVLQNWIPKKLTPAIRNEIQEVYAEIRSDQEAGVVEES